MAPSAAVGKAMCTKKTQNQLYYIILYITPPSKQEDKAITLSKTSTHITSVQCNDVNSDVWE